MGLKQFLVSAALVASTAAQVSPYAESGHSISVHVPTDTASSKSGPIYFQLAAPSGMAWAAFGQGSVMAGAQMFVIYTDSTGKNVTLSPRKGTGEVMPRHDSSIQATLLSGSGVQSDGSLIANVRCDSCLTWSGGSMDPTSTSSSWMLAYRAGSAAASDDTSATIIKHDTHSNFELDLVKATGNDNPFVATAGASPSASGTQSVSTPLASNNPNTNTEPVDGGISTSSDPHTSPWVHGVIMSLLFGALFPLAALTIYLPMSYKVRFIHAPLQIINLCLLIAGLVLGVVYGREIEELDSYHQVIGYVVFALIVAFQPALGLYQHLYFVKNGRRSFMGLAHQWIGRIAIALGIINGGLGWYESGRTAGYVPYGVCVGIMFLIYVAVVVFSAFTKTRGSSAAQEKNSLQSSGSDTNAAAAGTQPHAQ